MVTGAAGFIGSHFVDYVLENHPEDLVIGFDCLTYAGDMKNLASATINNRFEFVKGDIRKSDEVNPIVAKVDAIVNFAAETHVDRSISSSSEFVSTNVLGTNVLLEAALINKIEVFHQISTDEVYGSLLNESATEFFPLNPSSPYSASKSSADFIVQAFHKTHELNTRITRSSNNFGSRQYPEKLIPYFISRLIAGEKVHLYGDGTNVRDWIFVKDNVARIDRILRGGKNGNIYNIGSGNELTNLDITRKILALMKLSDDVITFVKDRPAHDFRYSLDISKLKEIANIPFTNFDQALEETINSYTRKRVTS